MGERRDPYRVLVGKSEWRRQLVRRRGRWEDNIKMDLKECDWGVGVEWIDMDWGGMDLYGLGWNGLIWIGLEWINMDWGEMDWYGLGSNGLIWIGVEWIDIDWGGMDWHELGWNGLIWIGVEWIDMVWGAMDWYGLRWNGLIWIAQEAGLDPSSGLDGCGKSRLPPEFDSRTVHPEANQNSYVITLYFRRKTEYGHRCCHRYALLCWFY